MILIITYRGLNRTAMGESLGPKPSPLLWNRMFSALFLHTQREGGAWVCKNKFERHKKHLSHPRYNSCCTMYRGRQKSHSQVARMLQAS